jgi:transcription initiation factor TFIIIB Brf1 subunit/transcription initiation factor TFIIB
MSENKIPPNSKEEKRYPRYQILIGCPECGSKDLVKDSEENYLCQDCSLVIKIEKSGGEEEWDLWRKTNDIILQEKALNEWSKEEKSGILSVEFNEWLKTNNINWERVPNTERVILLYTFLSEKEIIIPFKVFRVPRGDDFYFSYGYNNILLDFDEKIDVVINKLFAGLLTPQLRSEFVNLLRSKANVINKDRLDPIDKLRLQDGILDLNTLQFSKMESIMNSYYFTYYAEVYTKEPLDIKIESINSIKEGTYNIEENGIYHYFRNRFDDENWNYLIDALGTILSPYKHKLLVFLVGPPNSGKSTLLELIYETLKPLIANTRLETITKYTFGLEPLIGKQILMSRERGEVVLRKLDLLNAIFGEADVIDAPRKHKSAVELKSLKMGIIAMNDLPLIREFGGETMMAFFNRLSIIQMKEPDQIIPNLKEKIRKEEVFEFLLWCRVNLEKRNWEIRKKSIEDMLNMFREETNPVYRFLNSDYIIRDIEGRAKGKDLYDVYVKWSVENGITPVSLQEFYTFLAHRFDKYTREKVVWFKGISIKEKHE